MKEQDLHNRRDDILSAVGYATSEFLRSIDWRTALDKVLERLARATNANRAYFFENSVSDNGDLLASQIAEWTAAGVEPQIHNPDLQNASYSDAAFDRWADLMRNRQPVHGLVSDFPDEERELLEAQEIRSLFVMPVYSGDKWIGFLGFDDCENQRHWSTSEFDALFTSAEALGAAIERQKLEQELRFAQKMEVVGGMASGIAHDFNNTLQAIVGLAQIAQLDLENGDDPQPTLDKIIATGTDAGSLTRKLLFFSRKQEVPRDVIDLRPVVDAVVSMLKPALNATIKLSVKVADPAPAVFADAGLLSQVLLNLCLNARDSMPAGGTLSLACNEVDLSDSEVALHHNASAGKYARFLVTDTGHGMDDLVVEKVFEPFFSTKKAGEGTGLGLSVAHAIVSNFGGFIQVDSTLDIGTCFRVFIPTAKESSATPDAPVEAPGGSETILLVEDEPVLLEATQRLLEVSGYTVLAASDGEQGLELFQRQSEQIDIVLTDLELPDMDGLSMLRAIRESHPDTKTIIFSGSLPAELPKNNCEYLQKPVQIDSLIETIRAFFDTK